MNLFLVKLRLVLVLVLISITQLALSSPNVEGADDSNYYSRWMEPRAANLLSLLDLSSSTVGGLVGSLGFNASDDFTHGSGYIGATDLIICNPLVGWIPFLCPATNRDGIIGALNEATQLNRIGSIAGAATAFAKINVAPQDGGVCKAGSTASAVVSTRGLLDNVAFSTVMSTYYQGSLMETAVTALDIIATTPVIDIFNDNRVREYSFVTTKPYDTVQISIIGAINLLGQVSFYHTKCTKAYKAINDENLDADKDGVLDYVEQQYGLRTDSKDSDRDGITDQEELFDDIYFARKPDINSKPFDKDGDKLIDALERGDESYEYNTPEPIWEYYYSKFDSPRSTSIFRPIRNQWGLVDKNSDYGSGYIGVTDIVCNIIGIIPFLCPITNRAGMVSQDPRSHITLSRVLSLLGSANAWARINVPEEDGGLCKAGSRAEVFLSTRGLIDNLVGSITVSTYKDGRLREIGGGEGSILLSPPIVGVFTDNEVRSVGFITRKDYDSIRVSVSSLAGVIHSVNVYHARCSKGIYNRKLLITPLPANIPTDSDDESI